MSTHQSDHYKRGLCENGHNVHDHVNSIGALKYQPDLLKVITSRCRVLGELGTASPCFLCQSGTHWSRAKS